MEKKANYTKQGIAIFIGSIVFAALMAIPYCLDFTNVGSTEIVFTFRKLEIFGDGSILNDIGYSILKFMSVWGIDVTTPTFYTILEVSSRALSYLLLAYLFICVFDFFFSFLLIATKNEVLRKFCKVVSVFAGILMIFAFLLMLVAEVGFVLQVVKAGTDGVITGGAVEYVYYILKNGGLFYVVGTLLIFILCVKQFSWFHSADYDY